MKWPSWAHIPPDSDYDYRGRTQCNGCGKVILQKDAAKIEGDDYCEPCGNTKTEEVLHRRDE